MSSEPHLAFLDKLVADAEKRAAAWLEEFPPELRVYIEQAGLRLDADLRAANEEALASAANGMPIEDALELWERRQNAALEQLEGTIKIAQALREVPPVNEPTMGDTKETRN